ncbi:hypothetical protein ACFL0P_06340 [Candidatus Omnitrophota bacterium]
MDKTLRSILWVLVALVVLSSFSAGWFFVAKEKLHDEYVNLESLFKINMARLNREILSSNNRNIELKTKLEAIEKDMKALEAKNKDLGLEYEGLLSKRDDLDKELARVKKGKFFLERKLKDVESEKFVAGLLKEKVTLEVELKRLRDSMAPKEFEIEKLKQKNMDLGISISKITEEKSFLEKKLNDSTEVAEILSRDLLKEKDEARQYEQESERMRIENRLSKTKISELESITDKYNKLLANNENMQFRIASMERDLNYKNQEVDTLKRAIKDATPPRAEAYHSPSEVELPPIVLPRAAAENQSRVGYDSMEQNFEREGYTRTAFGAATSSPKWLGRRENLRGRIVTVNKEHGFVVVDLGKRDGIDIEDVFDVYRGDLQVGSIEVIQARERIAAADIKDTKERFDIRVDDVVVKR